VVSLSLSLQKKVWCEVKSHRSLINMVTIGVFTLLRRSGIFVEIVKRFTNRPRIKAEQGSHIHLDEMEQDFKKAMEIKIRTKTQ